MHLLSLLSLASLSLAAPHVKRQTCSSSTLQWTVTGFNTFTANPGPNGVSSISFDFVDQTSGTSSECGRSLPAGSGGSPADPNNFYSCANAAFQYKWDGTTLSLEETLQCGTFIEVATGSINPSLLCFSNPEGDGISGNAGTECETPTASVFLTGTADA